MANIITKFWAKTKHAWHSPVRYGGGGIGIDLNIAKRRNNRIAERLFCLDVKHMHYGVPAAIRVNFTRKQAVALVDELVRELSKD